MSRALLAEAACANREAKEEASHGALAKSVSTNIPSQLHRGMGNRRVDVSGGARGHRETRIHLSRFPVCANPSVGSESALSVGIFAGFVAYVRSPVTLAVSQADF